MEIVFATKNEGKLKEISAIFAEIGIYVISMAEAGLNCDVVEDGDTFEQNSAKKAVEVMRGCGKITMADDSGLEIAAFSGQPGVHSARYLGADTPYSVKNKKILDLLENEANRTARFVSVITAAFPNEHTEKGGVIFTFGTINGVIAERPAGSGGFGYDPIFYVPEYGMTVAEMPAALKNKISHRGKALLRMKERLEVMLRI